MKNKDVTAIAAGDTHSFAIKDGGVYSWGINNYGQLGEGTDFYQRETPVRVMNLRNAQVPQITSQPGGKTVVEGDQVTLEIAASVSGGGTLSY